MKTIKGTWRRSSCCWNCTTVTIYPWHPRRRNCANRDFFQQIEPDHYLSGRTNPCKIPDPARQTQKKSHKERYFPDKLATLIADTQPSLLKHLAIHSSPYSNEHLKPIASVDKALKKIVLTAIPSKRRCLSHCSSLTGNPVQHCICVAVQHKFLTPHDKCCVWNRERLFWPPQNRAQPTYMQHLQPILASFPIHLVALIRFGRCRTRKTATITWLSSRVVVRI